MNSGLNNGAGGQLALGDGADPPSVLVGDLDFDVAAGDGGPAGDREDLVGDPPLEGVGGAGDRRPPGAVRPGPSVMDPPG